MSLRKPFGFASAAQNDARAVERDAGLRAYMLRVYNYMGSALALTGVVALITANSPAIMSLLYTTNELGQMTGMSPLGWIVALAPLGLVLVFSFGINKLSLTAAHSLFWGFAVLMGLSMSSIFLMYTGTSVARVFFITAGMFGGMSLYGYTTKRDLTKLGSFMFMGLIGIIIASLVNIFLQSSALGFAISFLGVFIFLGLTAYDTQKLKGIYYQVAGDATALSKAALMGALNLYLDFINLFMMMLRLFGERR